MQFRIAAALLPTLVAQRHVGAPDREPLRAQLRRRRTSTERDRGGARGLDQDAARRVVSTA